MICLRKWISLVLFLFVAAATSFAWADICTFSIDTLTLRSTAGAVVAKYGKPSSKSEFDEIMDFLWLSDWVWKKEGISIQMNSSKPKGAGSISVFLITVKAPFAGKTDKGIRIGSAKNDVIKAYGKPSFEDENTLKYSDWGTKCECEVNFTLANGIVTEIHFAPLPP